MKRCVAVLVVSSGLFAFACGDDDTSTSSSSSSSGSSSSTSGAVGPKGTVSSCDLTADVGYCEDYAADAPADEAQNSCLGANVTAGFSGITNESSACPTANRVGSCVYPTSNGVKTTYRYYPPKFTTATAQTDCTGRPNGGGVFTAN